jgi:flagellar hook-basal body complex protein FliE
MVAGIGSIPMAASLGSLNPAGPTRPATGTTGTTGLAGADSLAGGAANRVTGAEGAGFGQAVGDALAKVGQQDLAVQKAAQAAATGDLRSVSDYMIAATEAQLTTQVTVAVRDRAISAFNDIMRMQI